LRDALEEEEDEDEEEKPAVGNASAGDEERGKGARTRPAQAGRKENVGAIVGVRLPLAANYETQFKRASRKRAK